MTAPREEVRIVPLTLPDGTEVLAEVVMAHGGGDASTNRSLSLDGVREDIARIGQFFANSVKDALPEPPDRYGIDFGLKLAVESKGVTSILAKVAAEATVTVRLEWDRPRR